jgi:DNA-directed RNA polymerase subunit RPC12/RpoP
VSVAAQPGIGPRILYPYNATCEKCGHKRLLNSPERAIKNEKGELEVITDYRADLAKHNLTWESGIASGRIYHIFKFVCIDCGKLTEISRPYEDIEPGCTAAGVVTLILLIVVIGSMIYNFGAEAALLIIPAAPFFFFVCSELIERPYAKRIRDLAKDTRCEGCKSERLAPLSEVRQRHFPCPKCGEKALRYVPISDA